jgi:hypothetical protein
MAGFQKSKPCVVLVRKAADETRTAIVFIYFGAKETNEAVVTRNELKNN